MLSFILLAANSLISSMKKHWISFLLFLLLISPNLMAQETEMSSPQGDDLETSMELGIEKKLSKKFSIGIDMEYRTRDYTSEIERFTIGPSLDYKINKHLKASVGGVYMQVNNNSKTRYRTDGSLKWIRAGKWGPRYRANASLTGDVDFGRFNVSLRERWQYTYREEYTTTRDVYTKASLYNYTEADVRLSESYHTLRSLLTVEYDINGCPLTPFVSVEVFNNMSNQFNFDKTRYSAGIDWKVNKSNSIELSYMYQDVNAENDDEDVNSHFICVGYKYSF